MNSEKALSVGQEALWFLRELAPESAAYNLAFGVRVRGRVDGAALRAAVAAVAARHDMIRSRFAVSRGRPVRLVGAEGPGLEIEDATGMDGLRAAAHRVVAEPFDLAAAAFRCRLVRGPGDTSVLVLASHHIASDALAHGIVLREVFDAYAALVAGKAPGWPEPAGDFDGHVRDEERLLASARAAELERHWRAEAVGAEAAELPTDRPRPPRRAFTGGTIEHAVLPEQAARIAQAADALGVTRFSFLLAAFQAVTHRYTRSAEFLVGCPLTTRFGRAHRETVGYFVNTVPVRARFGPATTFRETATAAQRAVTQGLAHGRYPIGRLVHDLGGHRDPGRSPLFQLTFTMVGGEGAGPVAALGLAGERSAARARVAGLDLAPLDLDQQEGQFDLAVEMVDAGGTLRAVGRYDGALFERDTVARFLGHLVAFAGAAAEAPDRRVRQVPLMDADEAARTLALGAARPAGDAGQHTSARFRPVP
ncbi:condensation domain-containing protein [Actinomadura violacea]|uniref:Condensation domain-containing protein n=1 Tax=Actinomadura violacea TaxID=2819934 RepID=A0ABS3RNR7_9ACTN|nr:condensation domain-containing protein [Actinomadura violacea]MBO2458312.1 hypothetical protein [Actinomadura violacea]